MNYRSRNEILESISQLTDAILNSVGDDEVPVLDREELTTPELAQQPVNNIASYEINIRQVNNGFLVHVGCQTFVFESFEKLSKYLSMYFENPQETEEKHFKGELFK